MTSYVKGYKGPMLPAAPPRGSRPFVLPTKPKLPMPSQAIDPVRPSAPIGTRPPAPTPTGPMVPVRGGGMAPASVATMMKKGGKVKCMAKGGSASKRADGIAKQGKTKGKIC